MSLAEEALRLDPDAPWNWTMPDVFGLLDQRQRRYVEDLQRIFRVKQAAGRVVPYRMEPYQAWFHAHAYLAMGGRAPDRIVEKGRGLGFTLMAAMDALMTAAALPRVKIPVAGRQASTGDEFVDKCWDLIEDSRLQVGGDEMALFDANPELRSEIHLIGNDTRIIPIPGGNPDSIRSIRSPFSVVDEAAFHRKADRLFKALNPVHSEGGQRTILSTHDGTDTLFFELVEKARKGTISMKLFSVPIHDHAAYESKRPILEQLQDGSIRLVAPWLSVAELEKMRQEDPIGYEQENLARVMDETLMLLSRADVDNATDPPDVLQHWERPITYDDAQYLRPDEHKLLETLIRMGATVPVRPNTDESAHTPVNVGVDFASRGDLAAYTAHEVTPDHDYQRWLLVLRDASTPIQDALLTIVEGTLRHTAEVIDKTGPGTGLAEQRVHRSRRHVMAIDFGSSTELTGSVGRVPIKKALAVNCLSPRITSGRIRLLGPPHPHAALQRKHLTAIRRSDLDAPRLKTEGHADIFWSNALAAWASLHTGGSTRVVREGASRFRGRDPFGRTPIKK